MQAPALAAHQFGAIGACQSREVLAPVGAGLEPVDVDAAVDAVGRRILDAEDAVAILDPDAGRAGEAEIVVLGERLHLVGVGLERRCQHLAHDPAADEQHHAGRRGCEGDARHRDAGGADHDELAAARQVAEPEQRADQRPDRQQHECLLWQQQQRHEQGVECAVGADADVALLLDELEQRRERHQHAHHEHREPQYLARQVAVEHPHRVAQCGGDWRHHSASAAMSTSACTHHTPTAGCSQPFSTQVRAADSRFE